MPALDDVAGLQEQPSSAAFGFLPTATPPERAGRGHVAGSSTRMPAREVHRRCPGSYPTRSRRVDAHAHGKRLTEHVIQRS